MATLTFVAIDIETTGFAIDDEVTVVGVALPLGYRIFLQPAGQADLAHLEAATLEDTVCERTDQHVQVSVHSNETALLEAVGAFAADRLVDDELLLVAYNGECWNGGFDLPFLRTRLAAADLEWPFPELPYADLLPVVDDLFNTTVDGEAVTTLPAAYAALCDGELNAIDPFEDSAEATTAIAEGRSVELLVHNVADIRRTAALGAVAQRYCSRSDFQLKSLTPLTQERTQRQQRPQRR